MRRNGSSFMESTPKVQYPTSASDYVIEEEVGRGVSAKVYRARCVPLGEIESVTPSRNPLSSPACSLDRLHVRYRGSKRGVLISPDDKAGFLHELVMRCPDLRLSGGRVERQDAP